MPTTETEKVPVWERELVKIERRKAEDQRLRSLPFTTCTYRTRSILIPNQHGCIRKTFLELV